MLKFLFYFKLVLFSASFISACGDTPQLSLPKSPEHDQKCAKIVEQLANFEFNRLPLVLQSEIIRRLDTVDLIRLMVIQQDKKPLVVRALAEKAKNVMPSDRLKAIGETIPEAGETESLDFNLATSYLIYLKNINDRSFHLRPNQSFLGDLDSRLSSPLVLTEGKILTFHNKTFSIWDSNTSQLLRTFKSPSSNDHIIGLDGGKFAQANYDFSITVWDADQGKSIQRLTGHTQSIGNLRKLADEKLASSSYDGSIKIWDPIDGRLIHTLEDLSDRPIQFQSMSESILVSSAQNENGQYLVKVWNFKEEKVIDSFPIESRIFGLYQLSANRFGVHTSEHGLIVFDIETRQRVTNIPNEIFRNPISAVNRSRSDIVSFASPIQGLKSVKVVAISPNQTSAEMVFDHGENVMNTAFVSENILITQGAKRVSLWNLVDGTKIKDLEDNGHRLSTRLTVLGQERWLIAQTGPIDIKYEVFDLWRPQCERVPVGLFAYLSSFFNFFPCS